MCSNTRSHRTRLPLLGAARMLLLAVTMPSATAFAPHLPTERLEADAGSLPALLRSRRQCIKKSRPLSLSPSGIDEWPVMAQAGVFTATYVGLAGGTLVGSTLLDGLSKSVVGFERWRNTVIDTTLPLLLGAFFLLAGGGHFVAADAFRDIYPPPGTWGLWYLPGSAAFHVAWTGSVETVGGAGLLFAAINNLLRRDTDDELELPWNLVQPVSALMLFLLTLVVTPANIYMFTHGAVMGEMAPLDVSFHAIRFGAQVLLLSLLLTLAKDSFFFVWGDELD